MSKFVSLRRRLAATAIVCAVATLTLPGGAAPPSSGLGNVRPFIELCRLYLDPHDAFTRVVEPSNARPAARANASLSTINVNYTGFTAEAQTAFRAAVDIWLTQLSSTVPIVVDAQFQDLGNPIILGHAGFRTLSFNFPGAPLSEVLYPGPIANRLSGVDRNGATTEILILLNTQSEWSFATDGTPVAGKVDFMSAVLHELAHGFGHSGSANVSSTNGLGSWGVSGRPYVYDVNVVDSVNNSLLNQTKYPNGSTTLASLLQGTGVSGAGLFWIGSGGILGNGGTRPRLY